MYIISMNFEASPSPLERSKIDIADPEEARYFIRERMERDGELPTISVPQKYVEAARQGIMPHTTWIYDAIIAGTLGREPYSPEGPEGESRALFRVKVPPEMVVPRFTGPDSHFHGVVIFKGEIPPEYLEEAEGGI
jgi:hypothetical protein